MISSSKKAVFFPDLKTKTAEINSLVKFCIEHSNDLECPEIEIDDDSNLDYHTRSAHHAMEDLLGSYLRNRQNVTNSKGQVKEYFYPFFIPGQKSFTQKRDAVNDLISALKGENVDITQHLSTYRNGQLGDSLRAFIKSSRADEIVGQSVETVSDFIQKLQSKNKWAQLGLD